MRLQPYVVFGVPDLDRIVLTASERATLRRAAVILDEVRTMRNARVPTDWYSGDEDDSDLCFGVRICTDLATEGSIDAPPGPDEDPYPHGFYVSPAESARRVAAEMAE